MTFELPLPPTPTLETDRLILRPVREEDAPAIQRQFADWEVVKYLSALVSWPYPVDGAAIYVAKCLDEHSRGVKFHWGITLKDGEDQIIGLIDLWPFDGEKRTMRGSIATAPHAEHRNGSRRPPCASQASVPGSDRAGSQIA